jgi:hypothetical protein
MPGEIKTVVKLGIAAAVTCSFVIQDGFFQGTESTTVAIKAGTVAAAMKVGSDK